VEVTDLQPRSDVAWIGIDELLVLADRAVVLTFGQILLRRFKNF
jgi:hypothetical protein